MMRALIRLVAGVFFLAAGQIQANELESVYHEVGELGGRYVNGTKGKSFNQGIGTFFAFEGALGKKAFKPSLVTEIALITGQATLGSGNVSGTVFSGGLHPGFDVHWLRERKVQPFFEVHAIVCWNYASLSPVVPKTNETTLAMGFGFEAGAGVHISNRSRTKAMRIHLSYTSQSANLAGQPGFQLGGLALSLGFAY